MEGDASPVFRGCIRGCYRNPEGYSDPTDYEAIRNLEKQKWRSLVYICSPYSRDVEGNILKARRFSRFAVD